MIFLELAKQEFIFSQSITTTFNSFNNILIQLKTLFKYKFVNFRRFGYLKKETVLIYKLQFYSKCP